MSIYVDPNEIFEIKIKYKEIKDKNNVVVGIKIIKDDINSDDIETCICEARGRDFDNMSSVLEVSSVINHITGKPMIQISKFCKMVILKFFTSWNNFISEDSNISIPINNETIGSVHDKIIRELAKQWLLLTDGNVDNE